MGICGDSSGGQVAARIAQELKNKLDFQILVYPSVCSDASYDSYKQFNNDIYILVPEVMVYFRDNTGVNVSDFEANFSPIKNELKSLPKCLMIAAELDPIVDDSKHYFDKLKENNIDCELHVIKGVIHGYFSQPLYFRKAFDETQSHIAEFYKKL